MTRQEFRLATGDAQVLALLLDRDDLALNARDLAEAPKGPTREAFWRRRVATRRLVAERLAVAPAEVEVGHDQNGAPRVLRPDAGLYVSVSGRADFCAIALASSPIGVDIEPLEPATEPVWSALHAREAALLRPLPGHAQGEAFLRLWTAKEAYLKALGTGFTREPAAIAVDFDFHVLDPDSEARRLAGEWRVLTLEGQDFLMACTVLDAGL